MKIIITIAALFEKVQIIHQGFIIKFLFLFHLLIQLVIQSVLFPLTIAELMVLLFILNSIIFIKCIFFTIIFFYKKKKYKK